MPLPSDAATPWPPPGHQKLAAELDIADAWWSGDPDRLAHVYGGLTADQAHEQRRPSRLASMFWGRPVTDPAKRRERVHVPVAADVAATGADLLFGGDDVRLQIPEAHDKKASADAKATEDHLTSLVDQIGLSSTLLEAAELAGALGGVYLRPTWDPDTADHPLLAVIHADRAIPEWRWGQLVGVTFWSIVERTGTRVVRHLERHEMAGGRGVTLHGLYIGTKDKLGTKVKLTDHPATRNLGADSDGVVQVPDGITGILPRYVPNALPNRRHRHQPIGRADTQGVETLMSSVDETMTSWMRDLRLGQRRIIVPDQYLERAGRGTGASFNLDQEVFSPLAIDPGSADSGTITPIDFELRTEDHDRTARALFERIVASAGYSPQSFGAAGDGGTQTATEVDAREDRSSRTTLRKRRYWGPKTSDVAEMMLIIDRQIFGADVVPMRPRVMWPDVDAPPVRDIAESLNLIQLAQAASIETKVKMLHPEWDDTEVQAEVTRIREDTGSGVQDPTGGFP